MLNGYKRWIGNGTWADVCIMWARNNQDGQVRVCQHTVCDCSCVGICVCVGGRGRGGRGRALRGLAGKWGLLPPGGTDRGNPRGPSPKGLGLS